MYVSELVSTGSHRGLELHDVFETIEELIDYDWALDYSNVGLEAEVGKFLTVDKIDRWVSLERCEACGFREPSSCHKYPVLRSCSACVTLE